VNGAADPSETIYPLEGAQLFVCEHLGDKATIDYEDIQGRSLLGEGVPIDEKYLRKNTHPALFNKPSRKHTNVCIIPFSNDLKNMIHGDMDGYRVLRGDRESIKIVTDAKPRPTYDVCKYSQGTSATTTTFSFMYKKRPIAAFSVVSGASVTGPILQTLPQTVGTNTYPLYQIGSLRGLKHAAAIINQNKILYQDGVQVDLHYAPLATYTDQSTWTYSMATYPTVATDYALVIEYLTLDNQPLLFEKGDVGFHRPMEMFVGTANVDTHIANASQHGRRGFNAGLYDIYVYSAYFRYLHLIDGRLDAAAA
jgi:hypothetical protein